MKTIEEVKNSDVYVSNQYDALLESVDSLLKNNSFLSNLDFTDTPISPLTMVSDETPICLADNVIEKIKSIMTLINNPQTAFEYSYVILGKKFCEKGVLSYIIYDILDCTKNDNLSNRITEIDNNKLNKIVSYGLQNGCDYISICHTHPKISEEVAKTTLAYYLSKELKEKESIREAGLNLSIQDLVSYQSLLEWKQKANLNIEVCQTILMFNGEISMISKNEKGYRRYINFYDLDMNRINDFVVPTIDSMIYKNYIDNNFNKK